MCHLQTQVLKETKICRAQWSLKDGGRAGLVPPRIQHGVIIYPKTVPLNTDPPQNEKYGDSTVDRVLWLR